MSNLKQLVDDLNEVLVQNLISGNYVISSANKFDVGVRFTDDVFVRLWMANGLDALRFAELKMNTNIYREFTKDEKIQIWEKLNPLYESFLNDILEKDRAQKIQVLENELNKLKNL